MDTPNNQPEVSITSGQLAEIVSGRLNGNADLVLTSVSTLEDGQPGTLGFIRSDAFAGQWASSACSAALVSAGIEVSGHDPKTRAIIEVPDADQALIQVLHAINPGIVKPDSGIHPLACIHPDAFVDSTARIGPGCVVGPGSSVGAETSLFANVVIGAGCVIGEKNVFHPGVCVSDRIKIGSGCEFFANTVIGADGFGFLPACEDAHPIKIPQIGSVAIGDNVEMGACCTVDRAKIGTTIVGSHVKMDDHVHVGHNCMIHDDVVLCGCTTLGGNVTIGKGTLVGGSVTVRDQVVIGEYAKIAGGAIIMDEVPDKETYVGTPGMPARLAFANYAAFRNLGKFVRRTEKALKRLEKEE